MMQLSNIKSNIQKYNILYYEELSFHFSENLRGVNIMLQLINDRDAQKVCGGNAIATANESAPRHVTAMENQPVSKNKNAVGSNTDVQTKSQ